MASRIPQEVIEIAKKYAKKSTMKHKLAAVVYKDGKIINVGYNKQLMFGPEECPNGRHSIHAEVDAIRGNSRKELWGASIFVYRMNDGLAKPCKACMEKITKYGITDVNWSG